MNTELKDEKLQRLDAALKKLNELYTAGAPADAGAHERAAANYLTVTFGISRPLSDRYVVQAAKVRLAASGTVFSDEHLKAIADLDDKFGAAFMVLPHHVDQILKGGKHMSRRFRKWGDEGDVFRVRGKAFRFTHVTRMKVGDITDEDIRKEGYSTKEEFEQMWVKSHPKSVAAGKIVKPDDLCWCHEYEAC